MDVERGFSLVELTITIALAALVLAIGVPGFQSLSHKNHAEAHLEEFISSVRLARQVALEHGRKAEVCPRDPNRTTAQTAQCDAGGSPDWENGWVVLLDGTAIMSNRHTMDSSEFMVKKGATSTHSIQFSPTGTLFNATCIHVKIDADSAVKQARINLAGHIQFDRESC